MIFCQWSVYIGQEMLTLSETPYNYWIWLMTGLFALISQTALSRTYFITPAYFTRSFSNWNVSLCYNLQNMLCNLIMHMIKVMKQWKVIDLP